MFTSCQVTVVVHVIVDASLLEHGATLVCFALTVQYRDGYLVGFASRSFHPITLLVVVPFVHATLHTVSGHGL